MADMGAAQTALPEVVVRAPSPIVHRPPARRPSVPSTGPAAPAEPAPAPAAPAEAALPGTLPIVTDQFATVTVVPNEEIRRSVGGTLGDLLFATPSALQCCDNGLEGASLLDAGGGNFAIHADAFGRRADNYRIPSYPYLFPPDPAEAPRATQPGAFNGRQPNSALHNSGESLGGSYVFRDGFLGLAVVQNDALYHIPGIDGEDHQTRIDAHQTKLTSKGEWRMPVDFVDAVRFWGGVTDYKHNELGLKDDTDATSDGVRQIFTHKKQEAWGAVEL